MADSSWLQNLINLPPGQPCSVIWRRSCPGAAAAYEGGMDLGSAPGKPVYALGSGQVIGAGYFWHQDGTPGYGVVTIRTQLPDGSVQDIYYQHITINKNITLNNQQGGQLYNGVVGPSPTYQSIMKNQLIGWVSPLGEVEVGVNAQWGGIWGTSHSGAWLSDPEPVIRQLMSAGGGTGTNVNFNTGFQNLDSVLGTTHANATSTVQSLSQISGIELPLQIFHDAQAFHPFELPDTSSAFPFSNWPVIGGLASAVSYPAQVAMGLVKFVTVNIMPFMIRSFFVVLTLVLIIAMMINLTSKEVEEHPEVEQAVMLAAM